MTVAVLNPLGAGLDHYTTSLEHVLLTCGVSSTRLDVAEPSSAGYGKAHWLSAYFYRARRALNASPCAMIATWPTVGYLDLTVLSVIARSTPVYVVMHDPRPLVYARGYGSLARLLARQPAIRGTFMVHSEIAAQAIREDAHIHQMIKVPHPMLAPKAAMQKKSADKTIRVLGQYKPDRDIAGLRQLAHDAPPAWRLEVIGRGWPSIEGWQVTDDFVDEDSFDRLIKGSHAILIPYTRFFQSGVAVRALEAGVPVVGPSESSLSDLLGEDCPWLVRNDGWLRAVTDAIDTRPASVLAEAQEIYSRVISRWSQALTHEGLREVRVGSGVCLRSSQPID